MLRPLALTAACALAATTATAEGPQCEDWWVARNLIFDRAGYCFSTPLGRALFDNAGCTTTDPALTAEAAATVAQIRSLETDYACAVDTTRTTLNDPGLLELYRLFEDIPVRDIGESGCLGYRGDPLALRSGARADAPVTGWLQPGMSVGFAHFARGDYDFLMVFPSENSVEGVFGGWAIIGPALLPCDGSAG